MVTIGIEEPLPMPSRCKCHLFGHYDTRMAERVVRKHNGPDRGIRCWEANRSQRATVRAYQLNRSTQQPHLRVAIHKPLLLPEPFRQSNVVSIHSCYVLASSKIYADV